MACSTFELASAAWERAVLRARVDGYDPSMLDMLCLAGEVGWGRLSHPDPAHTDPPRLAPATPIALFLREHAGAWQALRGSGEDPEARLTANARQVLALGRGVQRRDDVQQPTHAVSCVKEIGKGRVNPRCRT